MSDVKNKKIVKFGSKDFNAAMKKQTKENDKILEPVAVPIGDVYVNLYPSLPTYAGREEISVLRGFTFDPVTNEASKEPDENGLDYLVASIIVLAKDEEGKRIFTPENATLLALTEGTEWIAFAEKIYKVMGVSIDKKEGDASALAKKPD